MSWPRTIVASSVSQTRSGAAQLVESTILQAVIASLSFM
jgi:hypothetical protein